MKKSSLLLSLTLITAAAAIPGTAKAFDVRVTHDVFIIDGKKGDVNVGTLHCFSDVDLVDVKFQGFDEEACQYVCKWVNNAYLPSSTNFTFDEIITEGFADCEENSNIAVHTIIQLADPALVGPIKGFDQYQQKRKVLAFQNGEDGEDGETNGLIVFEVNGYPQLKAIETEVSQKP